MAESWSRRQFLSSLGYVGAAGVFLGRGWPPLVSPGDDRCVPTKVLSGVRRIKLPDSAQHPAMCDWTPDGRWCLFACQDTNSLAVIDRHRFEVDGVIPLETGDVPWDVAVSNDGRFAYVSNSTYDEAAGHGRVGPSTVSIVDVAARRQAGSIPVGASPNGLLLDRRRNRLWVANHDGASLTVVDLEHHTVIADVAVARGPFSMKQSPDGRTVVAVGFTDAAITPVDAESLAPGRTIPVGRPGLSDPHPEWGTGDCCYAAFSDPRTVWVTNFRTRTLRAVDLDRGEPTAQFTFADNENPISIACLDGRYAWVSGLNLWRVVDLRDRRVLADLVFPFGPPIGPTPKSLDKKDTGFGGVRELWFGVNPDSSVIVVPFEAPAGGGLLPGVGLGTDWYCSPEHLAAWMAGPVPEEERHRLREFLAGTDEGA